MADIVQLRKLYASYEGLIFNGPSGRLVDLSKRDKAILKLRELDAEIKAQKIRELEAAVAAKDAEIAVLTAGKDEEMTLNGGF